ncbi:Ribonuclease, T2 family [Handroanthus impetiginosus]|uniref:Ribonuclease, T2 family n=1 Tax=Handroanthus impetiginosus TaxID=429701 RepID=A0A2G9H905_9LAMI|nr:Ribonuclease, T2 family [Handroanthus impetiginosus]
MGFKAWVLIKLFVLQFLSFLCSSADFDFFYFVEQWSPSYCDTKQGCCYPITGRPNEDFGIHGLWPEYTTGEWREFCDRENSFNASQISDLIGRMQKDWPSLACPSGDGTIFWRHEWEKHGTCTSLDQHSYFEAALDLKKKANLLQVLENGGITPGKIYNFTTVKEAIQEGVGYRPVIKCNKDPANNTQLYEVYLCADTSAKNFIECPVFSHGIPCGSSIEFPSFSSDSELHVAI